MENPTLIVMRKILSFGPVDGAEEAIRMLIRGNIGRSDEPPQRILNRAVAEAIRDLSADGGDTIRTAIQAYRLFRLARTQRTKYMPAAFLEAREAYMDIIVSLCDEIPRELTEISRDARVERARRREVTLKEGEVTLHRPAGSSAWWLEYNDHRSTVYLLAGHLTNLRLRAADHLSADGARVISVLVEHQHPPRWQCHPGCALPAAAEIVIRGEGVVFSAWRQKVYGEEALLPHVGTRVRLGDVVILSVPAPPPEAREAEAPFWLERVSGIHEIRAADGYHGVFVRGEGLLSHPDHYTVQIPEGWSLAWPAQGETQFRGGVGD